MTPLLTIFTPTYNRAHLLPRLYESLCIQSSKNFVWLVIDDGSQDGTKELINGYIAQRLIDIKFQSVENGGKHRAINRAVNDTFTELFFIVDSDDFLQNRAVEAIEQCWGERSDRDYIAGICFRRATIDGDTIGRPFAQDGVLASMLEITYKHKINVDRAEVFKTQILKLFPFDEIEGEKFLPEVIVWNRISLNEHNKLICRNNPIYYCDYQVGGLSDMFKKTLQNNPRGFMRYYCELLRIPFVWHYPIVICKILVRLCQTIYARLMK